MRIRAIIEKEIIHIQRDIRMLYFAIIYPVLLLTLFGYTVSLDVKNIGLTFFDLDRTSQSRAFLENLRSTGSFNIDYQMRFSWQKCEDLLRQGRSRAIVIIPNGFSKQLTRGEEVRFQILLDGSDNNTARIFLGYLLGIAQHYYQMKLKDEFNLWGLTFEPNIDYHTIFLYNPALRSQNFIVPGLIAVILMIIGTLITSSTIAAEYDRGTMEQLMYTPVKAYELILGKVTPYFAIGLVQVTLVLLTSVIVFRVPFRGSVLLYYLAASLFLFCALGLGLFISLISKRQQVANMGAFLSSVLPAFLLSGFVFPVSSMPIILRTITYLVPAKYFLNIIHALFLKGAGWASLWPNFIALLVFALCLLVISVNRFKKRL